MVCFHLTMPNNNAWDGKWTGDKNKYYHFRSLSTIKERAILDKPSHRYNFGDGWTAAIAIEKIDAKEKRKRQRQSAGFCGYEWMVDSILACGEIKSSTPK